MVLESGGVEHKPDTWLSLQLLLDSALPIGSFAHSFGLESLVQDNRVTDGASLRIYLEGMLRHSWATSDLMIIKAVYVVGDSDLLSLPDRDRTNSEPGYTNSSYSYNYAYEIEKLVHLQRLGFETRDGIEKIGRRLLRLAPELFPAINFQYLKEAIRTGKCYGSYPLVYAILCRELSIPLDRTAEGYLYASVSTSVNAALRLNSMGQTEAQRLTASLFPSIQRCWAEVSGMDPADAYNAMPYSEIAMIRHEGLYSRLFMS